MKFVLLATLLGYAISASADPAESATLAGVVRDPMGASIAGAIVVVNWNMPRANGPPTPNASDTIVNTDRFGEFSVKLTPGFYDVCIHAVGFSATCDTVALGTGQISSSKTILKLSPLITSEYGDRFRNEMIVDPVPREAPKLPESITNPK